MKNVYEVLRQKELEVSRLKQEVEALRIDGEGGNDKKPRLASPTEINAAPDHSGWDGPQHW